MATRAVFVIFSALLLPCFLTEAGKLLKFLSTLCQRVYSLFLNLKARINRLNMGRTTVEDYLVQVSFLKVCCRN